MGVPGDHDEIVRLRDRTGKLERQVAGLDYGQRTLGSGLGGLRDELRDLKRTVDAITKADEIANAVADALGRERRVALTAAQKVAGLILAMFALLPAVEVVVHWIHGG